MSVNNIFKENAHTYLSYAKEALRKKDYLSADLFFVLANYSYVIACKQNGVKPQ